MKKNKMSVMVCLMSLAASPLQLWAAGQEFDFKDPKGVNAISFVLDSMLEPIMGVASGITGKVSFDPASATSLAGSFELAASSLHIENADMKKATHGSDWLDVAKYPKITFKIKQVKDAKTVEPNVFDLTVVADLTCKDVIKEVTVPVRASYLAGKLGERMRGAEGDLLVLRSQFKIKRADYNIKPSMGGQVVAEDIEIRVSIAGGAKKG